MQKAEEDGIGTGFRPYQDPRQEQRGPSLPSPQQRPVDDWRGDNGGVRWQGSPTEVCSSGTRHKKHARLTLLYSRMSKVSWQRVRSVYKHAHDSERLQMAQGIWTACLLMVELLCRGPLLTDSMMALPGAHHTGMAAKGHQAATGTCMLLPTLFLTTGHLNADFSTFSTGLCHSCMAASSASGSCQLDTNSAMPTLQVL